MFVSFTLTASQTIIAANLVAQYHEELAFIPDCVLNTDQTLTLEGRVLSYSGQRCPMIQDGAYLAILQVFGCPNPTRDPTGWRERAPIAVATATKAILTYRTSDKRLAWFDTLDAYMASDRAGVLEVAVYVASLVRDKGYSRQQSMQDAKALQRLPLRDLGNPARIAAQLSGDDLRAARILARLYAEEVCA